MAASEHPTAYESLVIIGAAMAFTLDEWDKFSVEFGKEFEEDSGKTDDEIKMMFIHLFKDVIHQLDKQDELIELIKTIRSMLRGM